MVTKTDFAKWLNKFFTDYLQTERSVSPNTIKAYRDTFKLLIQYYKEVYNVKVEYLTLKMITKDRIKSFLSWILDNRKCSIASRNYRLAAIHSFARYLQYEHTLSLEQWQDILSIKTVKNEKKPLNYLSVEGIKLLFEQPDIKTWGGRRHLAILSLLYETGARVQELIDLTPESLRISVEPYTILLYGKGRKYRIIPLVGEQIRILKDYMNENHLFDTEKQKSPLFYNARGEKLTRAGITFILKTYVDTARKKDATLMPKNITPHSLRHSKAIHLLQAGINLIYIRDILGHASIQTTGIYARADNKMKREALEKVYTTLSPEGYSEREWEHNQGLLDWLNKLGK